MSEIEDIFRFVIVAKLTEEQVMKIVKQIEKQIEVIKAFYHTDEETIFQESALYKVKSNSLFEQRQIQNVIKKSHANIVTVNPEFFVIEKTGFREETEQLYKNLHPMVCYSLFVWSNFCDEISNTNHPHFKKNSLNKFIMFNYFYSLSLNEKLDQLGRCRFMDSSEFSNGCLAGQKHHYCWL